ncbi:MAG: hypothetical protein IKF78_02715 [Atopobiaceae bacterium]|nr:hypothetical protein [Atopobiaceae bacterium]
MGLNGIDISSWQDDLVVSAMTTCDFVIVKATGGAGYSNECFRRHADETLAAGKLLGCYHYARDVGTRARLSPRLTTSFLPSSPIPARRSRSWTGRRTRWTLGLPGPRSGSTA